MRTCPPTSREPATPIADAIEQARANGPATGTSIDHKISQRLGRSGPANGGHDDEREHRKGQPQAKGQHAKGQKQGAGGGRGPAAAAAAAAAAVAPAGKGGRGGAAAAGAAAAAGSKRRRAADKAEEAEEEDDDIDQEEDDSEGDEPLPGAYSEDVRLHACGISQCAPTAI